MRGVSFRKDGWADGETPDKTGPSVFEPQVESLGGDLAGSLPVGPLVGPGLPVSLGEPGSCTQRALAQGAHTSPSTLSAPLRALGLKNTVGFPFLTNSKGCKIF